MSKIKQGKNLQNRTNPHSDMLQHVITRDLHCPRPLLIHNTSIELFLLSTLCTLSLLPSTFTKGDMVVLVKFLIKFLVCFLSS